MAPKRKEKKTPGIRGPKDHFAGPKAEFLRGCAITFQTAMDTGRPAEFYDNITRDFIAKFGDKGHGSSHDEPVDNLPSPDDNEDDSTRGCLTQEDADQSARRFNVLRTVSKPMMWPLNVY